MNSYEGIVIRLYPSAESDLVLRVVTREAGKLSLLAKYARKSKKRFATTFDLLDHGVFQVRAGRGNLALVEAFSPRPGYRFVRDDLNKITVASVLCDCCDLLLQEAAGESGEPYATLALALEAIDRSSNLRESLKALHFAAAHLLNLAGYASSLSEGTPSTGKLRKLLNFVEECAERKLESKASLAVVFAALREEITRKTEPSCS